MTLALFILAGLLSGLHAYTYGRWLLQRGNRPGAIFTFALAAVAAGLPILRAVLK